MGHEYSGRGATISKGINRGVGTILGGGLGSLVAILAQGINGPGKAVAIGASVFIFCGAATYIRTIPYIKKKYDYGTMIFILTFSLVSISGVRGDQIIKLASDRLSSIFIGSTICIFTSLFIFPVWSGDSLHQSLVSKFYHLASSIEECLEDYVNNLAYKKEESQSSLGHMKCLSVMSSKAADETMANFAKWEPWHGRFGFEHPWNQYLQLGDLLRDFAASTLAMRACLQSETQLSSQHPDMGIKEQYVTACSLLTYIMRELGDNISHMKRYQQGDSIVSKLRTMELCNPTANALSLDMLVGGKTPGGSLLVLGEIVDKVEQIIEQVDRLAQNAGFSN